MDVQNFLCAIFGPEYEAETKSKLVSASYSNDLHNLEAWIDSYLRIKSDYEKEEQEKDDRDGRIGYRKVNLRIKTQYGTVTMNDARTSIIAQSNTATVCGDCVVCRGKWMYEVQLKSRGSMRIGWLKHGQKCTRDKGVGDVYGSYGFDGNQKRLITSGSIRMYGETWHTGDILGVFIDFQRQIVEYSMNGRSFGCVGIDNVQFVYPAMTLTKYESVYVNFGREPFCYPKSDYEPLQRPTVGRIKQGQYFTKWIGATLNIMDKTDPKQMCGDISVESLINEIFKIFEIFFTDLIHDSYVMTTNIIPLLLKLIKTRKSSQQVMNFLNFLWDFMNTDTLTYTLRVIFERLRLSFREAAVNLDYTEQKNALLLIRELLKHRPTRLFAIKYIFFDRCDFGYFFHVKPLDDYCMAKEIPHVWWEKKSVWMEDKKKMYDEHGQRMYESLHEIELLQNTIISLLMTNNDGNAIEPSTRIMFLSELRDFAIIQKFSSHLGLNLDMPPPVALTTFFKLLYIFDSYTHGLKIEDIIPCNIFYDETISYEFCDRLGGLEDYLRSTLRSEIQTADESQPKTTADNIIKDQRIDPKDLTSSIISVQPPVNAIAMSAKISFKLEKDREKFFSLPRQAPVKEAAKAKQVEKIKSMPPLASNLPETGLQPRESAANRVGLMVIPEAQATSHGSALEQIIISPRNQARSTAGVGYNIGAISPSTRTSTSSGSRTSSTTRFISQLNTTVPLHEMNSADAINVLTSRLSTQNQDQIATSIPTALTPINESVTDPITIISPNGTISSDSHDIILQQSLPVSNTSTLGGTGALNTSTLVLNRSIPTTSTTQEPANEFISVALRDLLPVRSVPSGQNLVDELLKMPTGRTNGVVDEKRSNVELLDVILFIFNVIAKKQIQKVSTPKYYPKIAEIYLRFESHESAWNDLKYQEKTLIRTSAPELGGSTTLQIDPFDLYAFSEEGSATDYGKLSKKWGKLLARKSGSQSPTKIPNQVPLEYARYTTDIKDRKQVAFEVISGSLAGHEKILSELARDKLWVRNVVLTGERVNRIFRLLGRLCELLIHESQKGQLFSFLPDFYLLVVEALVTSLYLHLPTVYDLEHEFYTVSQDALEQVKILLMELHGDDRLVKEDCKDALDRIFATLVHTKYTLKSLEKIPDARKEKLILNLIKSYNVKRNVAANWILVRIWHGRGFAFRYSSMPNVAPTINKWMHLNINYSLSNINPNPSIIFQQTLLNVLYSNTTDASQFFNNILNNMNWACSEFLNMLQEVKQVAVKKEPVIVEPHTLHLISACYDFAVGMVRVVEMVIVLTNGIIIQNDAQNNEVLISRLLQTVCLTMSRLTEEKGCFRIFLDMEMASAETIQSFPLVAGLVGVLIGLFKKDIEDFKRGINEEPSLLIRTLYKDCLDHVDALDNIINSKSDFRLVNNPLYMNYINKDEQKKILLFIKMIQHYKHSLSNVALPDEEHICIICYSNVKDVYFEPCKHESCLICVKQLLMDTRLCFFCKTPIKDVYKKTGELIAELTEREDNVNMLSQQTANDQNEFDFY
ncbi:E3 ubiquitin-protein ligase RNF123-like [Chrysoperla carnea]|uniref:E3 ubiquitin-protein ligase RNF123-like n=1 Tax=Chrysoperla carnea TaxID=189513 RepID=UPI001D085210|nr:E3 ubiquitin-protein ligase RNF123-like [Chrysoperla carnea]